METTDELSLQEKFISDGGTPKQKRVLPSITSESSSIRKKVKKTDLPGKLKQGIENLSGISLDEVKVHYNTDKPAELPAHAYPQETAIHIAPRLEKHLSPETWHVVQQKQGRVKPTMQMKGEVNINDDPELEKEADIMGAKSFRTI